MSNADNVLHELDESRNYLFDNTFLFYKFEIIQNTKVINLLKREKVRYKAK